MSWFSQYLPGLESGATLLRCGKEGKGRKKEGGGKEGGRREGGNEGMERGREENSGSYQQNTCSGSMHCNSL